MKAVHYYLKDNVQGKICRQRFCIGKKCWIPMNLNIINNESGSDTEEDSFVVRESRNVSDVSTCEDNIKSRYKTI